MHRPKACWIYSLKLPPSWIYFPIFRASAGAADVPDAGAWSTLVAETLDAPAEGALGALATGGPDAAPWVHQAQLAAEVVVPQH